MKNSVEDGEDTVRITVWQSLQSTLSAFIGVQSNASHARDFKHGNISHFILIGLLFGLIFICTLVAVVQVVMKFSGS